MDAKMAQFIEATTNVTRNYEELRDLMERPHVATERPELMFEDVSVGQPRPTVAMNFAGPNFNDQHANGYHVHNQGLHGNFPPPPYNHGGPHLIVGDMMGNIHTRGNPKVKELEIDRNEDMYSMHNSDLSAHVDDRKYRLLEERLKVLERQGVLGMDITNLGLILLPKYVCLFRGQEDANALFKDRLAKASLEWYTHLERTYIRNWRDLAEAFVKHYQYNINIAPKRTQLQSLTHGQNESFKEYAQKWHELAARVQPSLMERELVDMFMGTLQGPYHDRMVGRTSIDFSELVMAGERIEACPKMGKIQLANAGSFTSGVGKKPFSGYPKKKEGEPSVVYAQRGRGGPQ
ncbi:uncharacterized protein LOC127136848 [Lathyrus oleraceus]|uniref:uncharacterized protein LOC127136848 n=1 Tax=Pisum sativum TaxID=3888 RepID=UPI0021CF13CA|nr:uncharacterized protein LOC127136848 [Pisum sativum]